MFGVRTERSDMPHPTVWLDPEPASLVKLPEE